MEAVHMFLHITKHSQTTFELFGITLLFVIPVNHCSRCFPSGHNNLNPQGVFYIHHI